MRLSLNDIAAYLSCPDDGAGLAESAGGLRCTLCPRTFSFWADSILDLLPSRSFSVPEELASTLYVRGYHREFSRTLDMGQDTNAWGAPQGLPPGWVRSRKRHVQEALDFLQSDRGMSSTVFCDLSAGAGYCTFRAAQEYRLVFHCDLSVDALLYAAGKAKENRIENIVFVRADYFQPPFRNSIVHLTCLDSLIRGPWHETELLRSIQRALTGTGVAVVDFHNWWHNPLRRLGLLPDNFVGNKSYTRKELTGLLESSGIGHFQTRAFVQEVDPRESPGRFLARLIPPTRLMVRLAGVNASPSPAAFARLQGDGI
jgi:SAM-dependent methyltransferase